MAIELDYSVIDAFTHAPFAGNPAAVVFGAGRFGDSTLQAIAAEFNLSETTFVLPQGTESADVRFRWFTPRAEVKMCGHATLAGVQALLDRSQFVEAIGNPNKAISIQTASGILSVRIDQLPDTEDRRLIWLDLPNPVLTPKSLNLGKLACLLGVELGTVDHSLPVVETQDKDIIVFVDAYVTLFDARPKFDELGKWCKRNRIRGVCLATLQTLGPSAHVQSRFFAPAVGINEDPVTGSVHGPLATYLVLHELVPHVRGQAAVTCIQAVPGGRAGLVRAMVTQQRGVGFRVSIAGECQTMMRGRLFVP